MMDVDFDEDEKKLYEEFYNLTGAKIRFKCDGYIQEGEILNIKPKAKRVTLNNVYFVLPDKRVFSGTLKYRFSDLVNYELIATAKELNPYPRFEYLENLLKGNNVSKKYSINDLFYDGYLSESDNEEGDVHDIKENEFVLEVPHHLENKVPHDSVIVDCFDLEWKQAIQHIGKQNVIGVSFHGYKLSRLGKLSWVCISTSWCVFLFDIEKLGVDAFNNGLKGFLEDTAILKVIHDCRFPSDCLAHQFDTKIVNVFDTLVADFVVSIQCYNDKHKYEYVQSLNSCLRIHLEIPPEFSYARDRCTQNNGKVDYFSKRSVSNALRYVLIKDTIYLLLLHEVLAWKLLGPLYRNVDRYLKVIAGASKQELDTIGDEISSPDCIPPSVLMYGIQTVQFKKLEREEPISLECKFLDPITGKPIDVKKHLATEEESNSNFIEVSYHKISSKENSNNDAVKDREQILPVLKKNENYDTESYQLSNKFMMVDRMIVRPSARHIDEVYHKLVNSQHFHSKNAESVINVKPSENYVSKFTMRMPIECTAFSKSASNESITVRKTGFHSTSENSPTTNLGISNNFSDYSDTWAQLQADLNKSYNLSQNGKSEPSNFKFVPAGMSC